MFKCYSFCVVSNLLHATLFKSVLKIFVIPNFRTVVYTQRILMMQSKLTSLSLFLWWGCNIYSGYYGLPFVLQISYRTLRTKIMGCLGRLQYISITKCSWWSTLTFIMHNIFCPQFASLIWLNTQCTESLKSFFSIAEMKYKAMCTVWFSAS